MTRSQGIHFGERFIWAYDVAVGVFLKHLIDEAEVSERAEEPWLLEAVSHWRTQAAIAEFGVTLNEDWTTLQRQVFVELAEKACAKLATRNSIPSTEIITWTLKGDLRISPRGVKEVLTAPVIELGGAIIALVSGQQLPPSRDGEAWWLPSVPQS